MSGPSPQGCRNRTGKATATVRACIVQHIHCTVQCTVITLASYDAGAHVRADLRGRQTVVVYFSRKE
jgi:hypothetical protein